MINDFYASRYASCLAQLDALQPSLDLDIHLQRHAAELSTAVSLASQPLTQPSIITTY